MKPINQKFYDTTFWLSAAAIYERNWRFVDQARLDENEKALLNRLVQDFCGGIMNV